MAAAPKIACLPNGPYYLLNDMQATPVPHLRRASGEACAAVRGVALCRCGGSKNKPFCDGTHGTNGFSDRNTADAASNRRSTYAGKASPFSTTALCARTPGSAPTSLPLCFVIVSSPGSIPTVLP